MGVWLIASLILGSVYKGNLKAALIAPRIIVPFRNLDELSHFNDYPPIVAKDSVLDKIGQVDY